MWPRSERILWPSTLIPSDNVKRTQHQWHARAVGRELEFTEVAIYKHPKSGVYFADVTVEKIRHRASLGTKKWQEALRLHKEFEARVISGKQPGTAGKGSFADCNFPSPHISQTERTELKTSTRISFPQPVVGRRS